jgi:hypothetical protein
MIRIISDIVLVCLFILAVIILFCLIPFTNLPTAGVPFCKLVSERTERPP